MAYITQDQKKVIATKLKGIAPKTWKYSLGIHHHSTIVLKIRSADVNLVKAIRGEGYKYQHAELNQYHYKNNENLLAAGLVEIFEKILGALNTDNYDNSDSMADYFDVGHYVTVKVGDWDKPFQVTGA
jgi:hypothetical protein